MSEQVAPFSQKQGLQAVQVSQVGPTRVTRLRACATPFNDLGRIESGSPVQPGMLKSEHASLLSEIRLQTMKFHIVCCTLLKFQAMSDHSDHLPIALRRKPRLSTTGLHACTSPSQRRPRQYAVSKASNTPRQTNKARHSGLNSITVRHTEAGPVTPPSSGHERSIQRAIPSTKRRRTPKTPSAAPHEKMVLSCDYDSYKITPGCNEVRIFPLRAILDDRVKRRIRRNGLSEEMNNIYGERKQRVKKNIQEMQRLRDQLAAKELENDILREQSSLLQDTSQTMQLDGGISKLGQDLRSSDLHHVGDDVWDMTAADGFTDGGGSSPDMDDFQDDTTLEIESTDSPAHAREKPYFDTMKALTPPTTSPAKPTFPDDSPHFFPASHRDVGVQASVGDAGQSSPSEDDVTQVRCELIDVHMSLETDQVLESQSRPRITPTCNKHLGADVDPDVHLQTDIMLQTLAEKTAALASLNSSISTLGSPGSDPSEILSALKDAFQAARQELEQIFLDDTSLPLTSDGVVILSSMISRLKDSAVQMRENETLLEEHCVRERHLGEQLSDRVSAMDAMLLKRREQDDRIFRLEADMERSEAAVDSYRKLLANARLAILQKDAEHTDFEAHLRSMVSVAADLEARLAQVQVEREVEMTAMKVNFDGELTMRDMEILKLHREVTALKEALAQAHDLVSKLQGENDRVQDDADRAKKAARDTVASLRTQLLQSLQMSEAFLG